MLDDRRTGLLSWISDNPILTVILLLMILGIAALLFGYKEGFASILGGLLGWIKGSDSESKAKLESAKNNSDMQFYKTLNYIEKMREQQTINDTEVAADVACAKAFCDELDIEELIDIGNSMLRDHGAFRGDTVQ